MRTIAKVNGRGLWRVCCAAAMLTLAAVPASAQGWRERTAMSEGRSFLGAAGLGEKVYVAGGGGITGPSEDFATYDPRMDFWRNLPPLPAPLEMFGMAALGGRVYVAGGMTQGEDGRTASDRVWAFVPEFQVWQELPALPAPVSEHAMTESNGALWIAGGTENGEGPLWRWSMGAERWQRLGTLPGGPRRRLALAAAADTLIVIGGLDAGGRPSARVDIYDIGAAAWRRARDLPVPLAGHAAAVLSDGRVHVTGGLTAAGRDLSSAHFAYDPAADRWERLADIPTPRHGMAAAVAGRDWVIIGGGAAAGAFALFTESDAVEIYSAE